MAPSRSGRSSVSIPNLLLTYDGVEVLYPGISRLAFKHLDLTQCAHPTLGRTKMVDWSSRHFLTHDTRLRLLGSNRLPDEKIGYHVGAGKEKQTYF